MIEIKNLDGTVLHTVDTLCGADLSYANLGGADLSGANLDGADLRGADLRGANLRGADLRGANLGRANLRGADLRGANLRYANLAGQWIIQGPVRSDGYWFFLQKLTGNTEPMVKAGCRCFTRPQARTHWTETRGGTPLGDETFAILDFLDRAAEIRGLLHGGQEPGADLCTVQNPAEPGRTA